MLFLRPLKEGDRFEGISGPESGSLYYIALEGEKLIGFCRYQKQGEMVRILEIQDGGDLMLMDGLLRAVFSYVQEAGVDRAFVDPQVDRHSLKLLMVPLDAENCVNSIQDFLYNCKKCKM